MQWFPWLILSWKSLHVLGSTCRPFTFQVEKTYCTIKQKIHRNYTVPTIFLSQKHSNGSVPKHLTVVSKRSGDATLAQVVWDMLLPGNLSWHFFPLKVQTFDVFCAVLWKNYRIIAFSSCLYSTLHHSVFGIGTTFYDNFFILIFKLDQKKRAESSSSLQPPEKKNCEKKSEKGKTELCKNTWNSCYNFPLHSFLIAWYNLYFGDMMQWNESVCSKDTNDSTSELSIIVI